MLISSGLCNFMVLTKKQTAKGLFMNKHTKNIPQSHIFPELFSLSPVSSKKVEVSFTAPGLSSNGGLALLGEFDRKVGFIDRLNSCIEDHRTSHLIKHSYGEMLRQRIFQIAAGPRRCRRL